MQAAEPHCTVKKKRKRKTQKHTFLAQLEGTGSIVCWLLWMPYFLIHVLEKASRVFGKSCVLYYHAWE